jgi:Sec1-binding region of Mso1
MSSYLSGLLTTTTSRYASLVALLPSNSEQDGETEDDTHLCRVLRAYYMEKGRPFPPWLPPDPKSPQPVQPVYTSNPTVGDGYGRLNSTGGASKLGSLWQDQPPSQQPPPPQSLRGRGVASSALRDGARPNPYTRQQSQEPAVQPRPLPSQRAGTHQAMGRSDSSGSAGPTTAQDRLKARLWGSAKASQSPPPSAQQNSGGSRPNPYERSGSSGAYGNGGGGYDDRSASMSSSRSGGGVEKPFVAATAPWATNEDEFTGSAYGSGGYARRQGGGGAYSGGGRF